MKLLKALIGLVVVVILSFAAFLLVGVFTTSVTTSYEMTVDAPVDEVYTFFMDLEKVNQWVTSLKSSERISGNPQEIGTKYKLVINRDGKDKEFIEEIIELKENAAFGYSLDGDGLHSDSRVTFKDVDGKTLVTATTVTRAKNAITRSMLPFKKDEMERRRKKNYDKLKELVEQGSL